MALDSKTLHQAAKPTPLSEPFLGQPWASCRPALLPGLSGNSTLSSPQVTHTLAAATHIPAPTPPLSWGPNNNRVVASLERAIPSIPHTRRRSLGSPSPSSPHLSGSQNRTLGTSGEHSAILVALVHVTNCIFSRRTVVLYSCSFREYDRAHMGYN